MRRHAVRELARPHLPQRQVEVGGEPWPQALPEKPATVGDVIGLVSRLPARGHPGDGAGEQRGVGNLKLRRIAAGRTGKVERRPALDAHRGPGADRRDDVARAFRRKVVDKVGARCRPGPVPLRLPFAQEIFLVEVEIRRRAPGIVLARGRPDHPEVDVVPLLAFDQVHVLEARRGLGGVEDIPEHGDVAVHVLHAPLAELRPRRVEHMRQALRGPERARAALLVEQVGPHMREPRIRGRRRRTTRQPDDPPAVAEENFDKPLRDRPRGAGDKRSLARRHVRPSLAP